MSCSQLWRALLILHGIMLAGCQPESHSPLKPPEPVATTRPYCFRAAKVNDLRMLVSTKKPGPDGFPVVVVEMWNNGSDEVLVEYDVDSVVLHCGPYEQHGPGEVFGRRREVLDPHEELNFKMPSGGWSRSATGGGQELMLPTELPKGMYELWATFRISGPSGGMVESDRNTHLVP